MKRSKAKRSKRASFGIRWALMEVALEYMLTGKLPKPKAKKFKKSQSKPKAKGRIGIDASKGRKRIPKPKISTLQKE